MGVLDVDLCLIAKSSFYLFDLLLNVQVNNCYCGHVGMLDVEREVKQ